MPLTASREGVGTDAMQAIIPETNKPMSLPKVAKKHIRTQIMNAKSANTSHTAKIAMHLKASTDSRLSELTRHRAKVAAHLLEKISPQ